MKQFIYSALFSSVTIGSFLYLLYITTADAQGAIALYFFAPLVIVFNGIAIYFGWKAKKVSSYGVSIFIFSLLLLLALIFFYIAPFIGFKIYSSFILETFVSIFKFLFNQTPYNFFYNSK